jgi:hypothetical protein
MPDQFFAVIEILLAALFTDDLQMTSATDEAAHCGVLRFDRPRL